MARWHCHNQRFVAACASAGIPLDSGFGPGAHEWGYWDTEIRTVLDRLLDEIR
ncbi:hypothetical protein AB0M20_33140 [Actinoplanes sp. NPDC051633]|uniref:hypothetical protein n=1 Tax=Actinoplanes sp. NPDC051633 TaxID=3155670 RepID=UPI003427478F